jgi:hypothetical protein
VTSYLVLSSIDNGKSLFETVLGSFRETASFVEAGLTGGYVPARV